MNLLKKLINVAEKAPHLAVDWMIRQTKVTPVHLLSKFISFLTIARRSLASLGVVIDWAIVEACRRIGYAMNPPMRPY